MPGRSFTSPTGYRYGFNGKENDDEVKGIKGSQQDYGMRIYDPRLGRFLSVDPLTSGYPWYTPYQFAGNKPIWAIDLDGAEELYRNQVRINYEAGIKNPKHGDIFVAANNKAQSVYNSGQWVAYFSLPEIQFSTARSQLTLDLDRNYMKSATSDALRIGGTVMMANNLSKGQSAFNPLNGSLAVGQMIQQAATNKTVKVPIIGSTMDDQMHDFAVFDIKASFQLGFEAFEKGVERYNRDADYEIKGFYMNDEQFTEFKKNGRINSKALTERKKNSTNFVVTMETAIQENGDIEFNNSNSLLIPKPDEH